MVLVSWVVVHLVRRRGRRRRWLLVELARVLEIVVVQLLVRCWFLECWRIPCVGGGSVSAVVAALSVVVVHFDACFAGVSETGAGIRDGSNVGGGSLGCLRPGAVLVAGEIGVKGGWRI